MTKSSSAAPKIGIGLVLSLTAGALGYMFFQQGFKGWYQNLTLPHWFPAEWVFGPPAFILYALVGIALGLVWAKHPQSRSTKIAVGWFVVQLVLAVAWNFTFFGLRSPSAGYFFAFLLWFAVAANLWTASKISIPAGVLLLPVFLWITYTSTLNYWIFRANVVDPRVAEMKRDPRNANYFKAENRPKDRSIFAEPEREIR